MSRFLGRLSGCIAVVVAAFGFAGCLQDNTGVSLTVSPGSLVFDNDSDTLMLLVTKNFTNDPFHPVVVKSSAPWVQAENCTEEADNCISDHPVFPLRIPIRVDRTLTELGTNRATLVLEALGATFATVEVTVEDMIEVAFTATARRVDAGVPLRFTDTTAKTDAAGDVIARLWDFGDGTTSTATDPSHAYTTPGIYAVSLTITTANTVETLRRSAYVTVVGGDTNLDFGAAPTNIFEGGNVTFDITSSPSDGPITSTLWNFGDDRTSTAANPTHTYTQSGRYTVSLTVTTERGTSSITKEDFINVQRRIAPTADFTLSPFPPVALQQTQLSDLSDPGTAPISQWVWEFEDGSFSTLQNPTYRFPTLGATDVKLTVSSAHGTNSKTISVNVIGIQPVADFTVSNMNPVIGESVQFTNRSTAGSAPIEQTLWEFGDGGSSSAANPIHAYSGVGVFEARLTVITPHGNAVHSVMIDVDFAPPVAAFAIENSFPNEGDTVQFTDESLPGTLPVSRWIWDFGDPNSGTRNNSMLRNPSHRYDQSGLYTVTLTVSTQTLENNTDTVVRTNLVNVVRPPVAGFTFATPNTSDPGRIAFTNTTVIGSQTLVSYLWMFGDPASGAANTSTLPSPSHVYAAEGTYTVVLMVSTQSPVRMSMAQMQVNVVFEPPVLDFTVETEDGNTALEPVEDRGALTTEMYEFRNLTSFGTEPDFAVEWDFGDPGSGDSNTSVDFDATHQFSAAGTYTVTLTGFPSTGEISVQKQIVVDAPPLVDFSAQPLTGSVGSTINFFDESDEFGRRPITSYIWTLAPNVFGLDDQPSFRYMNAGVYDITLEVSFTHSVFGTVFRASTTKQNYITINAN